MKVFFANTHKINITYRSVREYEVFVQVTLEGAVEQP
jgi:hypothetical protein